MSDHDAAMKSSLYQWIGATAVAAALACGGGTANAQTAASAASQGTAFHAPPVFTSQNGTLNILMNAKANPIPTITFISPTTGKKIHPTGFAYEICQANGTGCVWDYGGVRLALQQGDTLKSPLRQPAAEGRSEQAPCTSDPDEANLFLNPTNLHTHGLLTPARAADRGDPTFGDYIFVQVFNSANGTPVPQTRTSMGDVVIGYRSTTGSPFRPTIRRACSGSIRMCTASRSTRCRGPCPASSPSARSATTSPATRAMRRFRRPTSAT